MKRWLFLSLMVSALCGQSAAQATFAGHMPGIDSLARRVAHFGNALPQEKVYLHLDNTCYFVGDTIWYKGYVTRNGAGTLTDLSKILYVELLTPDGYLVERQQLAMPDGTAHGAFVLTDSLYAGFYELRAYTRWMLNFGQCEYPHAEHTEDMFYDKQMARDFFRDYEKLYSRVFPVSDKPDEAGRYPKDMTLRPMRRYYKSRRGKPGIDLKFYPEGGHVVAGVANRIAFELNDEDGQHLEAELSVQDRDGQEVARASTTHRGRGMFVLPAAKAGETYKAVFRVGGYDYDIKLPEAEEEGYALQISQSGGRVHAAIAGPPAAQMTLGLQIQHEGVAKAFRRIMPDPQGKASVEIPLDSLPTGVNQATLFDGRGRIYASRLFFVNRPEDYRPGIAVEGIKKQYAAFEPVELHLKLTVPGDSAHVSLAVRDHATDEATYDSGSMLTEMLLASELKGFVENPEYYFEADDSTRRQALDLLMMVQGWTRYDWQMMAGTKGTTEITLPERLQTLEGSVHQTYSLMPEGDYGESIYVSGQGREMPIYTTATSPQWNLQWLYGTDIRKMKKDVRVMASFVQGQSIVEAESTTQKGEFRMLSPVAYDHYILFLSAADSTKSEKRKKRMENKGFADETAYPDFYVKLRRFYPVFPKPYNYYQDAVFEGGFADEAPQAASFSDRQLATVVVRSKRGGLRKLDLSKPAIVVDAYDAFNLAADYGLNCGMYDWRTFSRQVAVAYLGDMGKGRHFYLQERYDGRALSLRPGQSGFTPAALGTMTEFTRRKYHYLRNLDKLYIYTDYVPREQGSWKYDGDNQPEVVIDYRLNPGEGQRYTYRDRRYVMRGYAVCTDFYSPDYSRKPLPEAKDHRRTLLWMPRVKFNDRGEATVRLYNNGKSTTLSVEAEGITAAGRPVVWKTENLSK